MNKVKKGIIYIFYNDYPQKRLKLQINYCGALHLRFIGLLWATNSNGTLYLKQII